MCSNSKSAQHTTALCVVVCCGVLRNVLQVMQCVAECVAGERIKCVLQIQESPTNQGYVCCSVLQCVAVCCSVLHGPNRREPHIQMLSVLQCIAVCCSVVRCGASV